MESQKEDNLLHRTLIRVVFESDFKDYDSYLLTFDVDHVSTNPLSKAHDNLAYEHTSFDPQAGGVLFQGIKLHASEFLTKNISTLFSFRKFSKLVYHFRKQFEFHYWY